MIYKTILATVLAAGLAGSASAQLSTDQKNNLADPDFILAVPLDLKDIPGELYEAVVWCEILDQNGGAIANTGSTSVSVQGRQACQGSGATSREVCPGQPGYKTPPAWSAGQIWGSQSSQLLNAVGKMSMGKLPNIKNVPPDTFLIGGKPPSNNWSQVQAITLRASTPGTVNPAEGVGYACHIGFKADVLIDGRHSNISVFGLDAGTLKTIPLEKGNPMPLQKDISGYLDGKTPGPFRPGASNLRR
jgi:hypothetical protein